MPTRNILPFLPEPDSCRWRVTCRPRSNRGPVPRIMSTRFVRFLSCAVSRPGHRARTRTGNTSHLIQAVLTRPRRPPVPIRSSRPPAFMKNSSDPSPRGSYVPKAGASVSAGSSALSVLALGRVPSPRSTSRGHPGSGSWLGVLPFSLETLSEAETPQLRSRRPHSFDKGPKRHPSQYESMVNLGTCNGSGITIYHLSYSYIHTPIAPLVAPVDSLFVANLNPHPRPTQ